MNINTKIFKNFVKSILSRKLSDEKLTPRIIKNSFGEYEVVEPWQVSQRRHVPSHIPKPSYSLTTIPQKGPMRPEIKDKDQVECMKGSCELAKYILDQVGYFIKAKMKLHILYTAYWFNNCGFISITINPNSQPGVTTDQLDEVVHEMILNNGAYPSPLNYHGFPKSICTSINNVACHGIPDNRPLKNGDILNVDVTVYLNGYHGDCSKTFEVGQTDIQGKRLIEVTEICLQNAIKICKPNEMFCNIGNIVEETANKFGYNVVPAFIGHGIGTYFHGPPDILHFAHESIERMQPGMTFTIEPVLSQGGKEVEILDDGWTAVTVDDARTAQVEHTILITDNSCDVMTK